MIATVLQWLGVAPEPAQSNTIDRFLSGESIPALSAAAGQNMIARQRQIEAEIRAYVLNLEAQIAELQAE